MPRLLLLTGTCGSGKTTVSQLLAKAGWIRIGEDEVWSAHFGNQRGPYLSAEHRRKRQRVHAVMFKNALAALGSRRDVVIDATVHETPAEEFDEYCTFFHPRGIPLRVRVLSPRVEVAIARDDSRQCWTLGEKVVRDMSAKFNGSVFGPDLLIDNSDETPEQTTSRILLLEWGRDKPGIDAWELERINARQHERLGHLQD